MGFCLKKVYITRFSELVKYYFCIIYAKGMRVNYMQKLYPEDAKHPKDLKLA